jgi:hypothetical protein
MLSWVKDILSGSRETEHEHRLRSAKLDELQKLLGPSDGTVFRAPGYLHRKGFGDVLRFRDYINGICYVTCTLIGDDRQIPNRWGQYELMLCTRDADDWAPNLLSRLAKYTHEATLQPGDTLDLGTARSEDSTVAALLVARADPPADAFELLGIPAGLMLCIGITEDEFAACKNFGSGVVLRMLKERDIYPITDLKRESVT